MDLQNRFSSPAPVKCFSVVDNCSCPVQFDVLFQSNVRQTSELLSGSKTRVLRTKTSGVIIVINDLGRKKITSVLMLKKGLKEVEWHFLFSEAEGKIVVFSRCHLCSKVTIKLCPVSFVNDQIFHGSHVFDRSFYNKQSGKHIFPCQFCLEKIP